MIYFKEDLPEFSKALEEEEISQLVNWLAEKDDKLRYHSLLLLQYRSEYYDDVYHFWNVFCEKLKGSNHRAGGRQILEECIVTRNKQGGCKTGEAVITSGGLLKARYVMHTVGSIWHGGNSDEENYILYSELIDK